MRWTGPQHAEWAEQLLSGECRWPNRIPDRMAAAQAHATLALASVMALVAVERDIDDAVIADWSAALPVPDLTADADAAVAQWAGEPQ